MGANAVLTDIAAIQFSAIIPKIAESLFFMHDGFRRSSGLHPGLPEKVHQETVATGSCRTTFREL